MAELVVRGVSKAYGAVRALNGVDLAVASGSLLAVLGPSGCGKTTLLRCIAGFERPDAGDVSVGGAPVAGPGLHVPAHRRRVAVVPQEGALFPHLSVGRNVGYGLSRAQRRTGRVRELLDLVGLTDHADRMPHQLSGGQQQRVAVARALAPRPPLVLLDEPFSALDASLRADVRRDVLAALRADGATAIIVTHDQGEALSVADEVAVMRDGRIVQAGQPAVVYRAPRDAWVGGFVGDAMLLPALVAGGVARTPLGPATVAMAGNGGPEGELETTVLVRPEQVEVAVPPVPGAVVAVVSRREFFGHDAVLTLSLADGTTVAARVLGSGADALVGAPVSVRVRGEVVRYPRDQ